MNLMNIKTFIHPW